MGRRLTTRCTRTGLALLGPPVSAGVRQCIGQKLSPRDVALYRAVDEVLHFVWDPIGVASVPQARDEYHGYLPQVFALVRGGSDQTTIAEYLTGITVDRMGLSPRAEHDCQVAELLLEWKRLNDEHHV